MAASPPCSTWCWPRCCLSACRPEPAAAGEERRSRSRSSTKRRRPRRSRQHRRRRRPRPRPSRRRRARPDPDPAAARAEGRAQAGAATPAGRDARAAARAGAAAARVQPAPEPQPPPKPEGPRPSRRAAAAAPEPEPAPKPEVAEPKPAPPPPPPSRNRPPSRRSPSPSRHRSRRPRRRNCSPCPGRAAAQAGGRRGPAGAAAGAQAEPPPSRHRRRRRSQAGAAQGREATPPPAADAKPAPPPRGRLRSAAQERRAVDQARARATTTQAGKGRAATGEGQARSALGEAADQRQRSRCVSRQITPAGTSRSRPGHRGHASPSSTSMGPDGSVQSVADRGSAPARPAIRCSAPSPRAPCARSAPARRSALRRKATQVWRNIIFNFDPAGRDDRMMHRMPWNPLLAPRRPGPVERWSCCRAAGAGLLGSTSPTASSSRCRSRSARSPATPRPPSSAGARSPRWSAADLDGSGLFDVIDRRAYIQSPERAARPPRFADWRQINAQALVTGIVDGGDRAGCWRSSSGSGTCSPASRCAACASTRPDGQWRRIAHKIADVDLRAADRRARLFRHPDRLHRREPARRPAASSAWRSWTRTAPTTAS